MTDQERSRILEEHKRIKKLFENISESDINNYKQMARVTKIYYEILKEKQ